ncbi:MAG: tRNA preQ1(34) S-adenosylmethionine ribosyltransferase-isomerase QueA [Planctomycetes bacterium SCN 63-9]|nr:MAG: tRNA preQ1(34) S-adenosylmethionine ribosyltransferase-isomerase QueA [Planctomycetes bacterium SCN 63-9]
MRTAEFDFDLPAELIAQHPVEPRDRSRLMVLDRRTGRIQHRTFNELPEFLDPRDTLARNVTRVMPARLLGHREATGGKWEGLFLRERPGGCWEMLASTRGRPSLDERFVVGQDLAITLEGRDEAGRWIVRPAVSSDLATLSTAEILERCGETPLPPYIRKGREGPGDRDRYQTIYARFPGSVAAPTAGLHFTDEVLGRLAEKGITSVDLTLHVGIGTFRPIEADRIDDHVLHEEWAELSSETATLLEERRKRGGRIVAVGTTSARTLETAASASGSIEPFTGPTAMYLKPGHTFQGLDALITNFHLPRSSLLVLVSALAGIEPVRAAYAEAIRERYRFYSYGDAMLIL